MKKYTKQTILEKSNFDYVYEKLKTKDYILLGAWREITTDEDYAISSTIVVEREDNPLAIDYGKTYLFWHNYGSSANKLTKKDFRWLLSVIFNNCSYFTLDSLDNYYNATDKYYQKQFEIRQQQLNNMEG